MFSSIRNHPLVQAIIQDPFLRPLIRRFRIGSFVQRAKLGALSSHSNYGYCVWHGAVLAKKLGYKKISVVEFGVASGNSFLALEKHAIEVEKLLGIEIEVYGFDNVSGLPKPEDYRDIPYFWKQGEFSLNTAALEKKLTKGRLVLGNVKQTLTDFVKKYNPAPIAFASFDLDYYSSTKDAFLIFDRAPHLPRVFTYFDDVGSSDELLMSEYVGQPLAINEFNAEHKGKISQLPHLVKSARMYNKIRVFHDFDHKDYNKYIGK